VTDLPNPGPLMRLALAYRSSMVLFSAAELDLFTAVAHGNDTLEAMAAQYRIGTEPLRLLLEACVVEGLMTRDGTRYANTPVADAFLVRDSRTYGGHALKYAEDLYPTWGGLAELVRTGRPTMAPETILGDDKEKTRAFVLAMHERAREGASGLGSVLPHGADFKGRKRLLDVGGGPGTYSMALVQQHPGLHPRLLAPASMPSFCPA
jgi:hypothetical protein